MYSPNQYCFENNKYYIFLVRESPKLSTTQSALWPVLFNIIFHSIIQTARLREKFIEWNLCVLFPQQRGSRIFHSKKFLSRLDQKSYRSPSTVLIISCHKLLKIEFSRNIFKVFSNIKLHEIQSRCIRVIPI